MKRLLVQLQLSNYDTHGTWILEADSGFQMCLGRVREMLKLNPELHIDVLGPRRSSLRTQPEEIVPQVFATGRVKWIEIDIVPNALLTRYDFHFKDIGDMLRLGYPDHQPYDAVYINDPMLLRHYKALFYLSTKYTPKFFVHSHFIDNPECPKFPTEASLWLGQCEAAIKADFNFWQCESAMNVFFESMEKQFQEIVVDKVHQKSLPWDDGYSVDEIVSPINMDNVRIDVEKFNEACVGKTVIFVPNRIGGRGRSSDYTNCGKLMFDVLPELRKVRQDFVVIAGNPSQKFLNNEIEAECGQNGYLNIVPDALNRDEYKLVAKNSDIVVGLYDADTYGGTSSRECIELGCVPLWVNCNEYRRIAQKVGFYPYVCHEDFSDLVATASGLIDCVKNQNHIGWSEKLQKVVRQDCSYESTTKEAMKRMNLL